MRRWPRVIRVLRWTLAGAILVALAVAAWFASPWGRSDRPRWWPDGGSGESAAAEDEHSHDHEGPHPDVLTLPRQAVQNLELRIATLERSDYERPLRVPAQVVDVPGVTRQIVVAKSSGEISEVRVLPGQLINAGEPLFKLQLTHEEAIEMQLELLEALAKLEVEGAEIERLESLQRSSPGAVAGSRLLEKRYEVKHLWHTIHSRRQTLILLGMADADVDALIERHRQQHDLAADQAGEHAGVPLVDELTIFAPGGERPADERPRFVVEKLDVHSGQHVDVGTPLTRLADYRTLRLQGEAFERDVHLIRHALRQGWQVTAQFDVSDPETIGKKSDSSMPNTLGGLPILFISPEVDPQTRTVAFFVELPNELHEVQGRDGRVYGDWRFRPGQRAEIKVPVERFPQSLVVPRTAVAEDGPHSYVFQVSGTTFVRRPVTVLYRDDAHAVLAEDESVFPGMRLAMNGAYQLQLALVNRASGPVDPHAGHSH